MQEFKEASQHNFRLFQFLFISASKRTTVRINLKNFGLALIKFQSI